MCKRCNGNGEIVRPKQVKTMFIKRAKRTENGDMYDYEDELVEVAVGGIDACPICARSAEIEYQVS